ncbi:MAG: thiamine pyrophosphate-dependent dehydrogenase E1 component subunit alpha, partial [Parafilimonas sp.]
MLERTLAAKAFHIMAMARSMANIYENNRQVCKYVHSTSKGHEAIQIAAGLQLLPCDFISPYYRDDSILLSLGYTPYQLMLQLLAKADDIFSAGRSYYCHPSSNDDNKPRIIHQSSGTGMQAIPTTGIAQGIQYLERIQSSKLKYGPSNEAPIVVCSMGDGSITEGEVSEALQFAVLKQLPVIYLIQDNEWGISVSAEEARAMNAYEYAEGFKGLHKLQVNGREFEDSFSIMQQAIAYTRKERKPVLVHASVPLLGHHTSGVRKEFYRSKEDLEKHTLNDPYPKLRNYLLQYDFSEEEIIAIENKAAEETAAAFEEARKAEEPTPSSVTENIFAETEITEETGTRRPANGEKIIMVDAALHAIEELMQQHPECILYGQDVG